MRHALIAALLLFLPAAAPAPPIVVYSAAQRANPASCGASCPSAHLDPLDTFPAEYWERTLATAVNVSGGVAGWVLYADGSDLYVLICEHCPTLEVVTFYSGAHQGDLYRLAGNPATDRMRTYGDQGAGVTNFALEGDYILRYEPFTSVDACDEGGAGDDPACCSDWYAGDTGQPSCSATTAPATVPNYEVPPLALDWEVWLPAITSDGVLSIGWGNGALRTRSDYRWVGECNANPDRRPQGSGTGVDACCLVQWSGPDANEARPSSYDPQGATPAAWGGRGNGCVGLTDLGSEATAVLEAGFGYSPVPGSSVVAVTALAWSATYMLGHTPVASGSFPLTLIGTPVPPGKTVQQVLPWRTTVSPGVFEWHPATAPVEMVALPSASGQVGFYGGGGDDTVRPSGLAALLLTPGGVSSGDSGGPKFVYFQGRWLFSGAQAGPYNWNANWWHSGTRWELQRLLPATAFSAAPMLNSAAP